MSAYFLRQAKWLISAGSVALLLTGAGTFNRPTLAQQATQQATAVPTAAATQSPSSSGQTIFVILMENHNWADIVNKPSAPYINQTLLPLAAHAEQYFNPPGIHPSEPNYLWLEAGTNFGIRNDSGPSNNHQSSTAHLTHLLDAAGISWKAYQEGISGKGCPLTNVVTDGLSYAPKHNPMIFFDDVTGTNDPHSAYCIAHIRPYSELATDLTSSDTTVHYNFITPDLCNDMHNAGGCITRDSVRNGDTWLAREVPKILASAAYQQNGMLFITWDESEGGDKNPIGLIALGQNVRPGYSNKVHYTHSSLLRTIQEVFNVTPLLGDAANATDLSDLFTSFPYSTSTLP